MLGYTPLGRNTPLSRDTPPGRYTAWQVHPCPKQVHPLGRHTPQAGALPGQVHPWAGTPPGQVHPWAGTPPGQAHTPGQVHPLGMHTPWAGTASPPPPPMVTAAESTNLTGMLSCLNIKFRFTQGKISTMLGCPILRTLDCNRFRMTHRRK